MGPPHTAGNEQRFGEIEGIAPPLTSVRTEHAGAADSPGGHPPHPAPGACLTWRQDTGGPKDAGHDHEPHPRPPGAKRSATVLLAAVAAVGLLDALPGASAGLAGAAQQTF
ncbi:hypothetical protein [Streptomyces sp. NPDC058671]|uniref:hypothetical protein n=1 Tax=Streptomyces sp. NPDC058671 TaxID=3346590 RepID=UPI00364E8797